MAVVHPVVVLVVAVDFTLLFGCLPLGEGLACLVLARLEAAAPHRLDMQVCHPRYYSRIDQTPHLKLFCN